MPIDETWLSTWSIDNYIRRCLQVNDCPQNISRLFDDITNSMKLKHAISALVDWRQSRSLSDLWRAFDAAEFGILTFVCRRPLTARLCAWWMTQWTEIDCYLSVYFRAVALLDHEGVVSRRVDGHVSDSVWTASC